jgi:hypothetical protein
MEIEGVGKKQEDDIWSKLLKSLFEKSKETPKAKAPKAQAAPQAGGGDQVQLSKSCCPGGGGG